MNFEQAYRGRRVLVTGHTGFKGSWLALWLNSLGAKVDGLALPPPEDVPSHFSLARVGECVTHRLGDIRDFDTVRRAFAEARPEVVFHLAAQALVRDSYRDPKATFDINVGGTVNVLEAARTTPSVAAVVVVTSDKCYENREWAYAYRENDPLGGRDPYSASKGAAEVVVSSYQRSFFASMARKGAPGLASARAGNVIGGGDWARDRIVADCVRALTAGEPITIRNPGAVRPWQHVLEPLAGYLTLGAKLLEDPVRYSEPYNFGPSASEHVTVADLVQMFLEHWGSGSMTSAPETGAPHEAHVLRLACDKAIHTLQWRPVLTAREAVKWTAEWYKAWYEAPASNKNLLPMSLAQLDRFMRRRREASALAASEID